MATECPHCYRTVIPRTSGECPNCRRNTKDRTDVDSERVTLIVGEKSQLPEVCCRCAELTRRTVRVATTLTSGDPNHPAVINHADDERAAKFLLSRVFGFWMTRALGSLVQSMQGGGSSRAVRVQVPMRQCSQCAKLGPIEPVIVDFDYCRMKFVVHRRFAEHFQELNRQTAAGR